MKEESILPLKYCLHIFLSGLLEKGIYRPNDICVAMMLLTSDLDFDLEDTFLDDRESEKCLKVNVGLILDKLSISEDQFKKSIQNLKSKEVIENVDFEFYK